MSLVLFLFFTKSLNGKGSLVQKDLVMFPFFFFDKSTRSIFFLLVYTNIRYIYIYIYIFANKNKY